MPHYPPPTAGGGQYIDRCIIINYILLTISIQEINFVEESGLERHCQCIAIVCIMKY